MPHAYTIDDMALAAAKEGRLDDSQRCVDREYGAPPKFNYEVFVWKILEPGSEKVDAVLEILRKDGWDFNAPENYMRYRTFCQKVFDATKEGRAEDLGGCLEKGYRNDCIGLASMALHSGSGKTEEVLELLLEYGWDINQPRSWTEPPYLERVLDSPRLLRWFLDHGADPNSYASQNGGQGIRAITPLSLAVKDASFETIKLVFEHGGLAIEGDLLNHATYRREDDMSILQVMQYLLDRGAPVENIGFFGPSPLYNCVARGSAAGLSLLLGHNADPGKTYTHQDIGCECPSPLQRAKEKGYTDIVEKLSRALESRAKLSGSDVGSMFYISTQGRWKFPYPFREQVRGGKIWRRKNSTFQDKMFLQRQRHNPGLLFPRRDIARRHH